MATTPPTTDCHLVLTTVHNVANCDSITFAQYLNSFLDNSFPFVLTLALIMIIFSGIQYMYSGVGGDTKAAKARIVGILGGIVFFYLIRLFVDILAPGLNPK